MHFYGFFRTNENKICLIYQYLCNGSLNSYFNTNKEHISDIYSMLTIIRIYQAIEYLHSNSFVYRDLKPFNILLDNDYIPYLTDFDTIRHPSNDENVDQMTNDIGTSFYISPEQFNGKNISYPTDIFLFGLFVYYVIEKKDLIHENLDMNNEIKVPLIQNASKNIQKLIEY